MSARVRRDSRHLRSHLRLREPEGKSVRIRRDSPHLRPHLDLRGSQEQSAEDRQKVGPPSPELLVREVPRKPVERTRHSHRLDRPLRRRRALRRARRRASQLQPASDVVVRMRRPPRRLRRLLSRRLAARARAHPLPRPNACVRAKPFPADRARPRRQRHPPMQRHPAQPRDYAAVSVSTPPAARSRQLRRRPVDQFWRAEAGQFSVAVKRKEIGAPITPRHLRCSCRTLGTGVAMSIGRGMSTGSRPDQHQAGAWANGSWVFAGMGTDEGRGGCRPRACAIEWCHSRRASGRASRSVGAPRHMVEMEAVALRGMDFPTTASNIRRFRVMMAAEGNQSTHHAAAPPLFMPNVGNRSDHVDRTEDVHRQPPRSAPSRCLGERLVVCSGDGLNGRLGGGCRPRARAIE